MMRVKKNDTVVVLTGRDKDKRGLVIDISPKKGKVMIKGLGMTVRHLKARRQGEQSMIKEQEGYLEISNVMPICTSCHRPCRVNSVMSDAQKKERVCNRCKASF